MIIPQLTSLSFVLTSSHERRIFDLPIQSRHPECNEGSVRINHVANDRFRPAVAWSDYGLKLRFLLPVVTKALLYSTDQDAGPCTLHMAKYVCEGNVSGLSTL